MTSQQCSRCGMIVKKTLSDRAHSCPHCGLVIVSRSTSLKRTSGSRI
ncbi:MAG: zinc ribbon domain-containing protein [Candidatus Methanoculleus thermohydrogenotrophicum]